MITLDLYKLGLILMVSGFIVLFGGVLLTTLLQLSTGAYDVSFTGGCIVIFFIPICFGMGRDMDIVFNAMVLLAIILLAITLVIYIAIYRFLKKTT